MSLVAAPLSVVLRRLRLAGGAALAAWLALASGLAYGDERSPSQAAPTHVSLHAALESIQAADLQRHARLLADDTFEGREAGSRGGRAAGVYLGREYQRHRLAGGGPGGGYYQDFGAGYRNILGVIPGSDAALKHEVIVVGAHYDHVGYGTASNSYGPIGYIHNGADDNASGIAALLELVEALTPLEPRPKRTLLFALWDGEEKGLLGSKHWVASPTVPLERVRLAINLDMIGRLRSRLEVGGTRTAAGLRGLVSRANRQTDLLLDFTWEMKANSDHHSFFARHLPVLLLHTGLHDDYHRPSDDPEKLNAAGMERVTRLLFALVNSAANEPLAAFRPQSLYETPERQRLVEQPLPPLPGRLGVGWDAEDPGPGVRVTRVARGSPAERAGLRVGDRIVRFADREVSPSDFSAVVLAAPSRAPAVVERGGQRVELEVELGGSPLRLGITWRTDDAEPRSVAISRVVRGSPAERAGLWFNDRIVEVAGERFATPSEFQELVGQTDGPLELTIERSGQLRMVRLETVDVREPAAGE